MQPKKHRGDTSHLSGCDKNRVKRTSGTIRKSSNTQTLTCSERTSEAQSGACPGRCGGGGGCVSGLQRRAMNLTPEASAASARQTPHPPGRQRRSPARPPPPPAARVHTPGGQGSQRAGSGRHDDSEKGLSPLPTKETVGSFQKITKVSRTLRNHG